VARAPLDERVARSVETRRELIRKFGTVPLSVLRVHRGAESRALFNFARENARSIGGSESMARVDAMKTAAGKEVAQQRRARGIFGGIREASRSTDRAAVSIMPAELVSFFVRYYVDEPYSGKLYLDPFAGTGVRMQVAARLGLDYIGFDVCDEYVAFSRAVAERIAGGRQVGVRRADSRDPSGIADGVGDFSFTSPPYYDTEFYGPEPEQLGRAKTYDDFIRELGDIYMAWLPKFKSGAYVVVNVNDLRRDGRFVPFHADVLRAITRAGYTPHDVWIVDGVVSGLVRAFAVDRNAKRIAPKTHEYALVFTVPAKPVQSRK
jgi:hypothetical protein